MIGFHDWEDIGYQGSFWCKMDITDRICLRCEKKDLRRTNHIKKRDDRYNRMESITKH